MRHRDPRYRLWLLALTCAVLLTGCTKNPNLQTPTGSRLKVENELTDRIGQLQTVAIDAQKAGRIPLDLARVIVTWTVNSLKIMDEQPATWFVAVRATWSQADILPDEPGVQTVMSLVERYDSTKTLAPLIDELLKAYATATAHYEREFLERTLRAALEVHRG